MPSMPGRSRSTKIVRRGYEPVGLRRRQKMSYLVAPFWAPRTCRLASIWVATKALNGSNHQKSILNRSVFRDQGLFYVQSHTTPQACPSYVWARGPPLCCTVADFRMALRICHVISKTVELLRPVHCRGGKGLWDLEAP